ncbi:MAG: NADH-quinone oxidoreductase subunit L [Deltaproteobacteria bacterium]|nr:NADH-quinone oxidoreductase subunit L [Deltaproteobacteria bacterium]
MNLLFLLILIPALAGLLGLALAKWMEKAVAPLAVLALLANVLVAGLAFHQPLTAEIPLGTYGFTLALRQDALSSFIIIAASGLAFLLSLYAAQFMNGRKHAGWFFAFYLLTIALLQGAVLANHLVTLLFFWEGMLVALFVMIALGHEGAHKTAFKAFFINGVTDLCMMAGIGLVLHLTKTLSISELAARPMATEGLYGLAFVLLMIGAISKAGSMPFHSWIPDAATDAPMPFMALMPGAMEKLIGIYFVSRISLDLFRINGTWASTLMMAVGAATVLLAVLMALVQKDFKRLLSFHAISQVGYMILGIGTGTAFGIVGGLFHMVNNALYKSTLFLTGGAVEHQAGTTDLKKVSGLGRAMPITFACFTVAALSISGFPFTNGFYSKELVYHGALEQHWLWYAAAALGSFFTAASFLKLGHAAFLGPHKAGKAVGAIKDPPVAMLVPMVLIAGLCLFFGLGNGMIGELLLLPSVAGKISGSEHLFGLLPHDSIGWILTGVSVATLTVAVLNHLWGAKRYGSGVKAVDHIHYAPVAHQLYDAAEKRWFDPYELALKVIGLVAHIGWGIDRAIDFIYNKVVTGIAAAFSGFLREAHNGSHATYLAWSIVGTAVVIYLFIGGF